MLITILNIPSFFSLVEHFDTTPDNRIKWFSAPPLSIVATKEPAIHTLEYLVKKKELEELVIFKRDLKLVSRLNVYFFQKARQELKSQPLGIKKTVRHTPKSTIVTEKNVDPIFAELVKGASASTGTASDTKLSAFTDVLTGEQEGSGLEGGKER